MPVSPAPILPGRSPFHVRGSTFLGIRAYIDSQVPGGLPAVLAHLPDALHREFASQTFLPVAMYDALPILPFTEATALAEGVPYDRSVRERARLVAERDLSGLYRLLLRAVSPATAAERLQKAAIRYFDFGSLKILEKSKQRCVFLQTGWPRPLLPWFTAMIAGYSPVVLAAAGARAPKVSPSAPQPEGTRAGVETAALPFVLSWE